MGILNSCLKSSAIQQTRSQTIKKKDNILSLYKREYELNSGKFGKVYKYSNIQTSEEVFIKFQTNEEVYKREVLALTKLNHNNIISIIDFSETEDNSKYFIIEEFAHNGDLFKLVNDIVINENMAKFIIKSVLDALIYAYEVHSISHRDIKLENILIMKDGTIKLADWGLSSFNVKNRRCKTLCGTLSYMAPEILLNELYNSNKSDVWSLGVLIFILCSGTKPYSDCDTFENLIKDYYYKILIKKRWDKWWKKHRKENKFVNMFSDDICNLIQRILDIDIQTRYSLNDMKEDRWFEQINYDKNIILKLIEETNVMEHKDI